MREIRADLNRRPAQACARLAIVDNTVAVRADALLVALLDCAKAQLAAMPRDEAARALQDMLTGRAVIAMSVSEGVTSVRFNPPAEVEWLFR